MFQDDFNAVISAAKTKLKLLSDNPAGYFIASMLAGAFVGFGVLLAFTIGGMLTGLPYAKVVMGLSFCVALNLVIIAGAELFTGNMFVMTSGIMRKTARAGQAVKLLALCYMGNWIGSVLLALVFVGTGLSSGLTAEFMAASSAAKMSVPFFPLLLRGTLCNTLVCLAVWSAFRCKTESGKMLMVLMCIFAFLTTGFEHSIANMTLLTISLLAPAGENVTLGGYFYNILTVTLGNMLGGVLFAALPYHVISREKK